MIELKNRGVVVNKVTVKKDAQGKEYKSTSKLYEIANKTVMIDKDSWTTKEWDLIAANKAFILFQDAVRKKVDSAEEAEEYFRKPISKSVITNILGRPDPMNVEDMSDEQARVLLKLLEAKLAGK